MARKKMRSSDASLPNRRPSGDCGLQPATDSGWLMHALARRDAVRYREFWDKKDADSAAKKDFLNLLRELLNEAVRARFSKQTSIFEITRFCLQSRVPFGPGAEYSHSMAIEMISWVLGKNPSEPKWGQVAVGWHLHQLFLDIVEDLRPSDEQLDCMIVAAERRAAHARGVPYPMWPDTGGALAATAEGTLPRSVDEVDVPLQGRIDCGALMVPSRPSVELSFEATETIVAAVVLASDGLQLQLQAFAMEPGSGIWDAIRSEMRNSPVVAAEGALVEEVAGPFGMELWTQFPAVVDDRPAVDFGRIFTHEGPDWMLRGAITGPTAFDRSAAQPFEELFREVVVVPPHEMLAPRTLIPLRLPE